MVNIVTLADGSKYMFDVGLGGDASARPLPLTEGNSGYRTPTMRLVRENIPPNTNSSQRSWIY